MGPIRKVGETAGRNGALLAGAAPYDGFGMTVARKAHAQLFRLNWVPSNLSMLLQPAHHDHRVPSLVDEELLALRLGNFAEAGFATPAGKSKDLPEFQSQVRTISLRET